MHSQHLLRQFLSPGGGGFFSTEIADFCFRETVAPSAPLALAGFSSYPTSIYESEPLLSDDDVAISRRITIPVPKEEGMEARALRGSNGASPTFPDVGPYSP
ncbi:hypothetical protein F2Q70_00018925 [Brassica cretica]|uniref:Uncharacterized protein n=1 Tax=Brassica cretica TaxID=69181 RepID=A0A8S9KY71_BRACR|nr:hypothetical protein F2Q70_00018925 [Brassica cretica]KAF2598647.1 hypothetical protein F2Q68_00012522 [Brassica cretica]